LGSDKSITLGLLAASQPASKRAANPDEQHNKTAHPLYHTLVLLEIHIEYLSLGNGRPKQRGSA
jgi:hypothetical protein